MENNSQNNLQLAVRSDLQMVPIEQAQHWYNDFVTFSKSILKKDLDYGIIPGTPKPTLLKAGAEKLRFAYGLGVEFETIDKVIDFDRPFVDYTYKCTIKSKSGQTLSQCEGNCNSLEAKFGFLWKPINELPEGTDITRLPTKTSGKKLVEFEFSINKAETTGQYGKPQEYWEKWQEAIKSGKAHRTTKTSRGGKVMEAWEMDDTVTLYRIMNPDVVGMKNTIMKMAQKRAFVGAILLATGASEFFTQDIEDMEINGAIYSNDHHIEDAVVITTETQPVEATPIHTDGAITGTAPAHVEKTWLDKGSKQYNQVVERLKNKTTTLSQVSQYFKLNGMVRAELLAIVNEAIAQETN